jgi:hypothetical protein
MSRGDGIEKRLQAELEARFDAQPRSRAREQGGSVPTMAAMRGN